MDSLKIRIPIEPHHFYTFSPFYLYAFQPIKPRRVVTLVPLDISCMFQIYKVERRDEFLGLAFRSGNQVLNGGAYLVAFMQRTRGRADSSMTLMRTPDIVIYNYPNVGTMAVSPRVNQHIETLLEEQ